MSSADQPPFYINKRAGDRFSTRPDLRAKYYRRVHNPERLKPTVGHRRIHFLSHVFVA
ncbi:hypothetical protein BJ085DRAFT_40692, partial [Dimargaris cristalligena]